MVEIAWSCSCGEWFIVADPDETHSLRRRVWEVIGWWWKARVTEGHRCQKKNV